jgi:type IX secretion system PorP/SprF family membrane protein
VSVIKKIFSKFRYYNIAVVMVSVLIVFCNSNLLAQDIHFSQFEASPLNLNPAQTGFFNGDYRFVGNHRKPYKTFSGSFDMAVNGISASRNHYNAGIIFNNDKAGDSELGLNQLALSFSVIRAIDKDSKHFISIGLQGGYSSRSINYSALNFDEQYTGDSYDPNAGNNETFENSKHGYADFNLGIGWLTKASDRFKAGAGISLQHLNSPNDAFFSSKAKVFPRLQADVKLDFAIAGKFDLVPALLYMNQGSFKELTGGTSVRYRISELPGKQYAFYIGGWYRSKDAAIASVGLDYNNLNVGVSYDYNTSDLDRASKGKGGYEISLTYIIRKVKPVAIKPPCPLY